MSVTSSALHTPWPLHEDVRSFSWGPKNSCPYPTAYAAFLHHADQTPDAVAVWDKSTASERTLTYRELRKHAIILSKRLLRAGVGPDQRIPIVARRSLELVVGILGVLLAGAQYVPLDGKVVPEATLVQVIKNTQPSSPVLVTGSFADRLEQFGLGTRIMQVESSMQEAWSIWHQEDQFSTDPTTIGGAGCYVIYTSGTTGTPKGVDVTHSNVVNLLCSFPGNVGMKPGLRVGSTLSISFDMGAWEILGALCNGCTLVLRGSNWADTLKQIDVLISTPTILGDLDPVSYPNIQNIATAGERLPQSTADRWSKAGKRLFTGCGPTEVTIVNTLHVHDADSPVCIGRPTPNNSVYVLDEDLRSLGVGEPGTLWAGGKCVTRGYVGMPEKTAERWRLDPFANDGSYMFDTGDIGYWLVDGTLQIVGRKDDQVKVKGFRVELDGVSSSLASFQTVESAVAVFHDSKIYAFVTPATCNITTLLEELRKEQPYYAIPEECFAIDKLPRTSNGKVDKESLRRRLNVLSASHSNAPTELEPPAPAVTSNTASVAIAVPHLTEKSARNGVVETGAISSERSPSTGSTNSLEKIPVLPEKLWPRRLRLLRLRIFIVYRTLFSIVCLLNFVALACVVSLHADSLWIGRLAYINLTTAILVRQDHMVNLIYKVVCSMPRSWPLYLRKRAAKVYQFGGAHSGFAVAGVAWYIGYLIYQTWNRTRQTTVSISRPSLAWLVPSWLTLPILLSVAGAAWPTFRKKHHDIFELMHRFLGWTALGFIWLSTMLSVSDSYRARLDSGLQNTSWAYLLATSVEFWLVIVITCSIALSWATLRRVPVEAEALSNHAIVLHFDYAVPVNGSFVRISHRPLLEWHSFATIAAPEAINGHPKGFSLVVSNAGDWTKDIIHKPRSTLWVRGVPTCGVMRIAPLFSSLVLIGTGSGIGPLLGFIQAPTCRYRLIWSTRSPETTYNPAMCAAIRKSDPQAVIHDTAKLGRPDLVSIAWNEVQKIGAEAVVVISNEKVTKKVVYGLEARGVNAFGAIWDS